MVTEDNMSIDKALIEKSLVEMNNATMTVTGRLIDASNATYMRCVQSKTMRAKKSFLVYINR